MTTLFTFQELQTPLQGAVQTLWDALAARQVEEVPYVLNNEPKFSVIEMHTHNPFTVQRFYRRVVFTSMYGQKKLRRLRVAVHSDALERSDEVSIALKSAKPRLRFFRYPDYPFTNFEFVAEPKTPEACVQLGLHIIGKCLQLDVPEARFQIRGTQLL